MSKDKKKFKILNAEDVFGKAFGHRMSHMDYAVKAIATALDELAKAGTDVQIVNALLKLDAEVSPEDWKILTANSREKAIDFVEINEYRKKL